MGEEKRKGEESAEVISPSADDMHSDWLPVYACECELYMLQLLEKQQRADCTAVCVRITNWSEWFDLQ